ncbi:beta-1,4-galactosyltransferase 4 isoform X2 [Chrysemys picta bellii]|uniref:beta-1,4-galactosyltransferase 4 isoform X2 n=1 Tax=Chrysemys picta bellii TaxID=8478 RepID=UPI0032B2968B
MGLSSVILHLSYKFRLLLIFILCMMVVAWATSSYLVDTVQETPKAKSLVENFRKATMLEKENQKKKAMSTVEVHTVKSTMSHCPALSPYLQGPSQLKFKASLTLEEVQKENPQVAKGRHRPVECSALQRVAILIPHRNRETHLLYLLEHLHPFLQRQQLDYGIYVIHQAGNTKFNRAKLLNVGYLEALKEENWDCFIFHDVDLVPENDFNMYTCDKQPKHLVVGRNNTGYRSEEELCGAPKLVSFTNRSWCNKRYYLTHLLSYHSVSLTPGFPKSVMSLTGSTVPCKENTKGPKTAH